MDFIITAVEVGALIVAFTLLNALVKASFKIFARTWLQRFSRQLETQQQNISLLLLLLGVGSCLLLVSVNSVLIYQGKSVEAFQLSLIQSIPSQFWTMLWVAIGKSVMLLLLVKFTVPLMHRLLDWTCRFAQNYDRIVANDEGVEAFFSYLKIILTRSTWILSGILCTQFLYLPDVIPKYLLIALKAYVAIAVGRLLIKAIAALVDTVDALSLQHSHPDNLLRHYERVSPPDSRPQKVFGIYSLCRHCHTDHSGY